MLIKVQDILKYLKETNLEVNYVGDTQLEIESFSQITHVKSKTITWIKNIDDISQYDFANIEGLLVVCNEFDCSKYKGISFIFCQNPKEVFSLY